MNSLDFSGQTVLVTGASSGIGFAVARGFALAGANLTILAIDEGVEDAARRISNECGNEVTAIQCDVADRRAVSRSLARFTRLDVLVHNAGLEKVTPIEEPGESVELDFRRVIDVNLMGSYYITRDALPHMPDGSRIVYTASTYSKSAITRMSAYCASKHALLGMMRSLAFELGHRKISVNAICPGWVKTEQSMRSVTSIAQQTGRTLDDVSAELLGKQAMAGLLLPDDLVGGYLFLASKLAKDITGQSLHVDRGEFMD